MQNNFKMDNELYHFGIKGQRWGVRRYQNPDGSLTVLGKKKYGTKSNFEKVQAAKKAASGSKIKAQLDREKANARTQAEIEKYRKKASKKLGKSDDPEVESKDENSEKKTKGSMTNEELRTATDRINLERNYIDAQKNYIISNQQLSQVQPKKSSKGKEFAKKIWNYAVEPAVMNAGKQYLEKMLKETLGLDKNPMVALEKKAKEAELKKKIYESESAKTQAEQQAYNFERNKKANSKSEKETKSKEAFENAKKQVEDYYNNVYSKTQSGGSYSYTRDNLTSPKTYTKPISNPALLLPGPNDKITNTKSEKGMSTNTAYSMIKDYSNNKSAPLNSDKAASVVFNDIMKSMNSDYKSVTLKTKVSDINSNYKNSESVNSLITDNSKLTVKELMKKSGYNKFYDKAVKHSDEKVECEMMNQNELYHHGIKGQKWGIRRYQNPDGSLTAAGKKRVSKVLEKSNKKLDSKSKKVEKILNKNSGVMSNMVKPLININQMAYERTDHGKMLDKAASYKKNDIDKLNLYRDYQVASKKNMESIKGKLQRIDDNDLDPGSAFTMNIFGKENAKKLLSMDYESSKAISKHSEKRVNELLNTFKDVPIKEVESYRYVTIGNTTTSWNGTKYVIDKR